MLRRAFISLLCLMSAIILAAPALSGVGAGPGQSKPVAYNLYFGDLHAHTSYSDAWEGTPWDAYAAAAASGADFMALTDHVTLWNAYGAFAMNETQWQDTLAAAEHFTTKSFVAIPGYEAWMLGECGEVNVYNAKQLPTGSQLGYKWDRLPNFYDWIAKQGAVGQFNHPTYMTRNFFDYAYLTPSRDSAMGMIEVWNDGLTEQSYVMALDAGWHVMPTANSDTHNPDWMTGSEVRTVLLAPSLTADNLYAAMSASRGYATLDKNIRISFTVNTMPMGSILSPSVTSYSVSIGIEDPDGTASDAVTLVELVSDGGNVVWSSAADSNVVNLATSLSSTSAHYYYLRVSTGSGIDGLPGLTAWTSPVWTGR